MCILVKHYRMQGFTERQTVEACRSEDEVDINKGIQFKLISSSRIIGLREESERGQGVREIRGVREREGERERERESGQR